MSQPDYFCRCAAFMRFKKLNSDAITPLPNTIDDAGYDLHSCHDTIIEAGGKGLVKTGLSFEIPRGLYGRIAPRSSVAWKHHIDVGAGVVDACYRGEVGVVLYNLSKEDFVVKKGDRIAQLILTRYEKPNLQEVDDLSDTVRGEGGFGSTGK